MNFFYRKPPGFLEEKISERDEMKQISQNETEIFIVEILL